MSIKTSIRDTIELLLTDLKYYKSIKLYPFDTFTLDDLNFPACIYEIVEKDSNTRNRLLDTTIDVEFELWLQKPEAEKSRPFALCDTVDSLLFNAIINSLKDKVIGLGQYIQKFKMNPPIYLVPNDVNLVVTIIYTFDYFTSSDSLLTNNISI